MTFLILTYVSEAGAAAYEETDAERQETDRVEHVKWFNENGAALRGGYKPAWPRRTGRIADDQQLVMLDGPFAGDQRGPGRCDRAGCGIARSCM